MLRCFYFSLCCVLVLCILFLILLPCYYIIPIINVICCSTIDFVSFFYIILLLKLDPCAHNIFPLCVHVKCPAIGVYRIVALLTNELYLCSAVSSKNPGTYLLPPGGLTSHPDNVQSQAFVQSNSRHVYSEFSPHSIVMSV